MDRTERFYRIERLLQARRAVPASVLLDDLGVSLATFKRDVQYMRDRLNAPIIWDREAGGYRLAVPEYGPVYELPGLWFSTSELYALVAAHECFAAIDAGVLAAHIGPLKNRIRKILEVSGHSSSDIIQRVRFLPMTKREVEPKFFATIAGALFKRRRIQVEAYSRVRDEVITRIVSPQRLAYYRDNWFLDTWCHLREGLRSFSVDTIRSAIVVDGTALDISEENLDAHFASSYGIFAGEIKNWAILRFSPMRARWVEYEQWHPEQTCEHLDDGGCRLSLPYSDEREILMDILRHGAEVVVEAPESLRELVAAELGKAGDLYRSREERFL
ncbi:MAG: WYL domain-containing protein [bacterium]|nr:WYL domain-containing protein [bacterium]MDT8366593.1 WYL domain-containing protein [bacterium]